MSKATHVPAEVETRVVKPGKVVLELTEEEAQALLVVCGAISGDHYGPRGLTSGIYNQLCQVPGLDSYLDLRKKYGDKRNGYQYTGYIEFV